MALLDSLRNHPVGIKLFQLTPSRAWEKFPGLFFSLCAFTLVASLLLGGGTRGGFLSDTILELIAIPAFLVSLSSLLALPWTDIKRPAEWALMICLAIAVVPLLQLVPLPPWIWTRLPHRDEIAGVFDLLGREQPWFPVSVSPNATWLSALSLLPPIAIFLGVIQLGYRERRLLSLVFLGVGILGAFIGLLQVAQGPSSSLRFFAFTNVNEAVGFFANRNHFAAILYVLLLYSAAWVVDVAFRARTWSDRRSLQTKSIPALTLSFLVVVVLLAAEAVTRSRAGLGLTIAAVFGVLALALADRRRAAGAGVTPIKLILGSMIVAIVLVVQFALYRILDRIADDPLQDARVSIARNTIAAAEAYMPFGSGVGTFTAAYPTFEPPQDTIANMYANHAHNDLLEIWLESGAVGIILVVSFAVWLILRSQKIWRRPPEHIRPIDVLLARAATIAIALIAAHSLFDYPLRTGAMMAVFALSCALLIEPLTPATSEVTARLDIAAEEKEEKTPRLPTPEVQWALDDRFSTPEMPVYQLDPVPSEVDPLENESTVEPNVATVLPAEVLAKFNRFPRYGLLEGENAAPPMVAAPAPAAAAPAPRTAAPLPAAETPALRTAAAVPAAEAPAPRTAAPVPVAVARVPVDIPTGRSEQPAQSSSGLWGEDIKWPDQWRSDRAPHEITVRREVAADTSMKQISQAAEPQVPRALGVAANTPEIPVQKPAEQWGKASDWPGQWRDDPAPDDTAARPRSVELESDLFAPEVPRDLDSSVGAPEESAQPHPAPNEMTVLSDVATEGGGEVVLHVTAPEVRRDLDVTPDQSAQPHPVPIPPNTAVVANAEETPRVAVLEVPKDLDTARGTPGNSVQLNPGPNEMVILVNIATEAGAEETLRVVAAPEVPGDLDTPPEAAEKSLPAPKEMTAWLNIATEESGEVTPPVVTPVVPTASQIPAGTPEKSTQSHPAPNEITGQPDIATEGSEDEARGSVPQGAKTLDRPLTMAEKTVQQVWEQWLKDINSSEEQE